MNGLRIGLCVFAIIYLLKSGRVYMDLRSEEDLRVGNKLHSRDFNIILN